MTLLSDPAGADLAVARTVLWDPHEETMPATAGVLLTAGSRPDDLLQQGTVSRAAQLGFTALVVKAYGDTGSESVQRLARDADSAGVALLLVPDAIEWLHLDSLITSILATAAQTGDATTLASGDLFALAGAIAATVGGATSIEDFSRRILAYSHDPDQPIDEERREGILGRQVPDSPGNDAEYRALYLSESVMRFEGANGGLPRMAIGVRVGEELLGSIWVIDADMSLSEESAQVLQAAAPVAALHLLRARATEHLTRQVRRSMVLHLLEGHSGAGAAAEALGLDLAGPFGVLAFAPAAPTETGHHLARLLDLVTLQAEARVGHAGVAHLDGIVHVVVSGARVRREESLRSFAGEVVAASRSTLKLELLGSVSRTVPALAGVPAARAEAGRLLALLRSRPGAPQVATATDMADQLVLDALAHRLHSEQLASRAAESLIAYDEDHGTDYARCVLAYLDALREVNVAARRLSLHPNTLRYRLRRATELCDLQLADPDHVLVLWLSLRTRRGV